MRKTASFFVISGAIVLGNIGWLTPALAGPPCYWLCDGPATIHPSFGDALSTNNALQIINPNPARATGPARGTNGVPAVAAYRRYLLGRVKEPVAIPTRSSGAK